LINETVLNKTCSPLKKDTLPLPKAKLMRTGIILDNDLNSDIRVLREIGILNEQDIEVFVLCFGFGKKYENPVSGITIERINIRKKIKDILFFILNTFPVYEWFWAFRIKRFILKHNIGVIHVHDLYMSRAAHAGIFRSGKNIPMILDLHENYPFTVKTYNWTKGFIRSRIARPLKWAEKEAEYLSYASRIIVLSDDFRDLLQQRYPRLQLENFTVLPNVPDLAFRQVASGKVVKNPFLREHIVILYYGVIAERRGVFDAIRVFSELVNENVPVNLLFIGPVDKTDKPLFQEFIGKKELNDRICHIPWIESADLPSYLAISDICIAPFHKNPQHESGVANKIYDYMLGGKPLIVSDCKPQKELVERHSCGLVFSDSAGLKDAIIKLVSHPELRETMGKNGREAVQNEYNTGVIKDRLFNLYNSLT
jgi:glycosyltransferase involved in cell wall biosynthesis